MPRDSSSDLPADSVSPEPRRRRWWQWLGGAALVVVIAANHLESHFRRPRQQNAGAAAVAAREEGGVLAGQHTIGIDEAGDGTGGFLRFATLAAWDFDRKTPSPCPPAVAAWRRLTGGESFEAVAREASEDAISKPKGGHLGCIPRDTLGKQFTEELEALKPGEFGRPAESPRGFHIIRREPLTDADLLEVLRQDVVNRWWAEEQQRLQGEAKIEVGDAK